MGLLKPHALLLAALAAATAGTSPARGQCRLCDAPTTALPNPAESDAIELEIQTSLDFGRLILAGDGQGAAVIRPDGSSGAQGALSAVSARAMVGTAAIHGAPGRAVRVELCTESISTRLVAGESPSTMSPATCPPCRGSIRRGTSPFDSAGASRSSAIRRAIIGARCRSPSNISEPRLYSAEERCVRFG